MLLLLFPILISQATICAGKIKPNCTNCRRLHRLTSVSRCLQATEDYYYKDDDDNYNNNDIYNNITTNNDYNDTNVNNNINTNNNNNTSNNNNNSNIYILFVLFINVFFKITG